MSRRKGGRLGRATEGGADRGAHDVQRHAGGDFQDAPLALQPRRGVGVAPVDLDLVRAADHEHGAPDHDQGPQRVDLCIAQWLLAVERVDGGKHVPWGHAVVMQHRRHGHRQLADRPAPAQVTKVDHAVGPAERRLGCADDVVVGEVGVHDLEPQLAAERLDQRPHAAQRPVDDAPAGRVPHRRGEQGQHASGMAQVPLQRPFSPGVLERRQRAADPAGDRAEPADHLRTQVARAVEGAAAEEGQDAGVTTAVGQVVRPGRRHGCGEPEIRQSGGQPRGRGGLGVELLRRERRVRDLQHPQRAAEVVFEQEVGVLLAAKRARGHRASQHVRPDRACLGLGQLRGRQLARGEEVEAPVHSAHRCRPPSCVHSGARGSHHSTRSAVARPRRESLPVPTPASPPAARHRRSPVDSSHHGHGHGPAAPANRRVHAVLAALLVPCALLTVLGVAWLFPLNLRRTDAALASPRVDWARHRHRSAPLRGIGRHRVPRHHRAARRRAVGRADRRRARQRSTGGAIRRRRGRRPVRRRRRPRRSGRVPDRRCPARHPADRLGVRVRGRRRRPRPVAGITAMAGLGVTAGVLIGFVQRSAHSTT